MRSIFMRSGFADLPLHDGKVPRWMFAKMQEMAKGVVDILLEEYGKREFLRRISNPFWFQSFACVIGFDWHSSGTTTVLTGALKEIFNDGNYGIKIAGGKGQAFKTIEEIKRLGESLSLRDEKIEALCKTSRICAKVDTALLQDGHGIYHHVIIFTEGGEWAVVQQGMNPFAKTARRYHWCADTLVDMFRNPHSGFAGKKMPVVLNLTSGSTTLHKTMIQLLNDGELKKLPEIEHTIPKTHPIFQVPWLTMPRKLDWDKIKLAMEEKVQTMEELLMIRGIGSATLRAIALVAELLHGEEVSWEDPVKFTFTVGGKDGVPYPFDAKTITQVCSILRHAVESAKVGNREKLNALRRISRIGQLLVESP